MSHHKKCHWQNLNPVGFVEHFFEKSKIMSTYSHSIGPITTSLNVTSFWHSFGLFYFSRIFLNIKIPIYRSIGIFLFLSTWCYFFCITLVQVAYNCMLGIENTCIFRMHYHWRVGFNCHMLDKHAVGIRNFSRLFSWWRFKFCRDEWYDRTKH